MRSRTVRGLVAGGLFCFLLLLALPADGKSPVFSGDGKDRILALTFDDGPHEIFTHKLLDMLWELDVRASFFLVGKMAERQPALVREIFARGHTVANHSHTHPNFSRLTSDEILQELCRCNEVLEYNIPVRVRFFRPPGGNYTKEVLSLVEKAGLRTVLWDINSRDYAGVSASAMTTRVVSKAVPGSILLFHSGVTSTIEALPGIVGQLREKGFEFVSLDEMLSEHPSPQEETLPASASKRDPEKRAM